LVGRAELQIAGGNPAPARADLDRAIAVTPHVINFPDPILYRAYLERGRLREAAGDGAGAISDWTQTMRITGGAPDPYLLRGRALLEAGDWLTGRNDLTQAVSLLGNSLARAEDKAAQAALLNMRGLAFNLLNDPQRALADLEQSLTIQPQAWVTHYNLGATYLKLGHPDQALIALRQALQLDRPAAQAAARTSRAYADLRDEPAFQALIGA
nr:tetratricopeptide repeat protein [Chloroflexota bacterium]